VCYLTCTSKTLLLTLSPYTLHKIFFYMSWFSSILIARCYNVSFPFCTCTRSASLIPFILYLDSNQWYIFSLPCTLIRNFVLSTLLLSSFYVPPIFYLFSCLSFLYSFLLPFILFLQIFIPLLTFLCYMCICILKYIKVIQRRVTILAFLDTSQGYETRLYE